MALHRPWLPDGPSLVRVQGGGLSEWALWREGRLLSVRLRLDELLSRPLTAIRDRLASPAALELDPDEVDLLAPIESQEVWAAGVTYRRSREARMEEAAQKDVYALVYRSERPELFFKSAGWRVVAPGGEAGIRSDSNWDVPEPELAVLCNSLGELVGFSCGNDMSSRSIEGENPLYLPQAKVYDRSCSLGPALVPAWEVDTSGAEVRMEIVRDGREVFGGGARLDELVRDPVALCGVLLSSYPMPAGAWLLTGTSIVPPPPYTSEEGDLVSISIDGLGTLQNRLVRVPHTGATAPFIGDAAG
jgi:2-dehydro-3-deoxy-D-arabinonate dehydratase